MTGQPKDVAKNSAIMNRLDQFLEEQSEANFTEEQTKVLREFAKILLGFKAMGTLGSFAYRIAGFIMFFIGIYISIKLGIVGWIQEITR